MRVFSFPTAFVVAFMLFTAFILAQPVRAQEAQQDALLFSNTLEKANKGEADAQNLLGALFEVGAGTPRNEAMAVQWYSRAADQGHAAAQANLATMYMEGKGTTQDYAKGIALLKLSAAQGLPLAIAKLGSAYILGQGVRLNRAEGIRLLQQASNSGDGFAAYQMGIVHLYGYDVPKNQQEAVKWFRLSAERGYATGQTVFAGYVADERERISWYSKAAGAGNSQAQYALGMILNDKAAGYYNPDLAARWFRLAADNGYGMAEQALFRMGLPGAHGRTPINRNPFTSVTRSKDDVGKVVAVIAAGLAIALLVADTEPSSAATSDAGEPEPSDCEPGGMCGGVCPPGHIAMGNVCVFVPPPM